MGLTLLIIRKIRKSFEISTIINKNFIRKKEISLLIILKRMKVAHMKEKFNNSKQ
jgi:hypothetical protein